MTLDDVARLDRGPRGEVFGRRNQADDIDLGLEPSEDFERTEHRGGAGLVELHVFHIQRRLDRNPAGVERHALANQGDRGARAAAVFQDDEARFLGTALRDRQERAHPFLLNLREVENRDAELVLLGELLGLLRQVPRRADIPRLHLQVAGQQVPRRNRVADAATRLGFVLVPRIHDELDRFELRLGILRLFLQLSELPAALGRPLDRDLRQLRGPETAARLFCDCERKGLGPEAAGALGGDRGGAADRGASDLADLPHANEQHALRLAAAIDEQGLVFLAFVVPRRDGALKVLFDFRYRSLGHEHRQQRRLDTRERLIQDKSLHARCAMIASANAEVETSVAPGIWRARS